MRRQPRCAPCRGPARRDLRRTRASAAPTMAATTAGAPQRSVTPCRSIRERISSPSTLRTTTWVPPIPVTAYGMPQPLQWNIGSVWSSTSRSLTPVCHPNVAAFEPAVAVSELDPLRASGRARGVVDRARGVLVGLPRSGRCSRGGRCEQRGVVDPVEAEAVIDLDAVHLAGQIGVVEEDRRPRMADDVGDLVGGEPEVDRHQDAAETADPEEGGQEPARVRADDGHAFSVPDPELVEGEGHATSARLELAVGLRPERTGDRRLVLHGSSVAIDERGPLQEIAHRQRDPHVPPISRTRFYPTGTLVARLRPSRGFPARRRGRWSSR